VDDAIGKLAQICRAQNDPDIHIDEPDKDVQMAVAVTKTTTRNDFTPPENPLNGHHRKLSRLSAVTYGQRNARYSKPSNETVAN